MDVVDAELWDVLDEASEINVIERQVSTKGRNCILRRCRGVYIEYDLRHTCLCVSSGRRTPYEFHKSPLV
jgi:hypothetical protein